MDLGRRRNNWSIGEGTVRRKSGCGLLLLVGVILTLGAARGSGGDLAPFLSGREPVRAQEPALEPQAYLPIVGNGPNPFRFAVTADMRVYSGPGRYDTPQFFRGACEAIADTGSSAFMVTPGDLDPAGDVYWTITSTLGSSYRWYPGVGNHELPGKGYEPRRGANMAWLRAFDYGEVNPGPSGCPETTYSFDYENAHFVMLNEYCDATGDTATAGDIPDHLYNWLVEDLVSTDKAHVFVFGHEPAYPQPDAATDRLRHLGDSLDQYPAHRDRFWHLLGQERVDAYICGHTHNYSLVNVDGMWQLDVGHARGLGDTGAPSTFVMVEVVGDLVTYQTYRDDAAGGPYALVDEMTCGLPADFDCDSVVELEEVRQVMSKWRSAQEHEVHSARHDLDDNGAVTSEDVMRAIRSWGHACQGRGGELPRSGRAPR